MTKWTKRHGNWELQFKKILIWNEKGRPRSPLWCRGLMIWFVPVALPVRSQSGDSDLGIRASWHSSGIAQGWSSDLIPGQGTSIRCGYGPKRWGGEGRDNHSIEEYRRIVMYTLKRLREKERTGIPRLKENKMEGGG